MHNHAFVRATDWNREQVHPWYHEFNQRTGAYNVIHKTISNKEQQSTHDHFHFSHHISSLLITHDHLKTKNCSIRLKLAYTVGTMHYDSWWIQCLHFELSVSLWFELNWICVLLVWVRPSHYLNLNVSHSLNSKVSQGFVSQTTAMEKRTVEQQYGLRTVS